MCMLGGNSGIEKSKTYRQMTKPSGLLKHLIDVSSERYAYKPMNMYTYYSTHCYPLVFFILQWFSENRFYKNVKIAISFSRLASL